MKTLNQLRKSPGYKKLRAELKKGSKKPRYMAWRQVEEIAKTYSFLCWKNGDSPSERITRALAYHDDAASSAL